MTPYREPQPDEVRNAAAYVEVHAQSMLMTATGGDWAKAVDLASMLDMGQLARAALQAGERIRSAK